MPMCFLHQMRQQTRALPALKTYALNLIRGARSKLGVPLCLGSVTVVLNVGGDIENVVKVQTSQTVL